jgi:hypothetical protein
MRSQLPENHGASQNTYENKLTMISRFGIVRVLLRSLCFAGGVKAAGTPGGHANEQRVFGENVRPRFSIIVVDCDSHTPRESAQRGVNSGQSYSLMVA